MLIFSSLFATKRRWRVILKHKNEHFDEISGKNNFFKVKKLKEPKESPDPGHSEEYMELMEEFHRYVNLNRLNNVISKIGQVQMKDAPKLNGMLAKDALEDFMKDYQEKLLALSELEQKQFKKKAPEVTKNVVKSYFQQLQPDQ